jgi:hypothetical protein
MLFRGLALAPPSFSHREIAFAFSCSSLEAFLGFRLSGASSYSI